MFTYRRTLGNAPPRVLRVRQSGTGARERDSPDDHNRSFPNNPRREPAVRRDFPRKSWRLTSTWEPTLNCRQVLAMRAVNSLQVRRQVWGRQFSSEWDTWRCWQDSSSFRPALAAQNPLYADACFYLAQRHTFPQRTDLSSNL